jgi:hypothetical protein
MAYEVRINGRKVKDGAVTALFAEMENELERQVKRAVESVYCEVHRARPSATIRNAGAGYRIEACCDDAARRAQAALERL